MNAGIGQKMRALTSVERVPETPAPMLPMAPVEPDWDDEDDLVDFQDDSLDDTLNVAAEVLEAAAAAERQSMAEIQRPKVGGGAGPSETEPSAELAVMIRVAGSGAVVTNKGGSEELADAVAYTHRLVDLVGDLLGLERFIALECVFQGGGGAGTSSAGHERCLLFTESNGDTVLVRPRPGGDVQALRESLGL